jgi:hypothetical protein
MMSDPNDLSIDNLRALIATMPEWSMASTKWTPAQTAAWRLRWFGRTPEQDAAASEEYRERRDDLRRRGIDPYERPEREPFTDWPNGQGTYD